MLDLTDLVELCRGYRDMGNSITDQLDAFVEDPDLGAEDFNPAAVTVFLGWLDQVADLSYEIDLAEETRLMIEDIKDRT